jgi:hypothetical protein
MRWPYDKRAESTHAWGALGVGTAAILGIPAVLATIHATDRNFRWWWPSDWMIVPLLIVMIGLTLLIIPVQRSQKNNPSERISEELMSPAPLAFPQQTEPRDDAVIKKNNHPIQEEIEFTTEGAMVYDIRLNPVKDILVRYINRSADIAMISTQAGLDQGAITSDGPAVNYWQAVLERACVEGPNKIRAVLDCSTYHLRHTVAEPQLRAAISRYQQVEA